MVQWLRFCTPSGGGLGSIPGWGTKVPQAANKSSHATTKEPICHNEDQRSLMLQLKPSATKYFLKSHYIIHMLQLDFYILQKLLNVDKL